MEKIYETITGPMKIVLLEGRDLKEICLQVLDKNDDLEIFESYIEILPADKNNFDLELSENQIQEIVEAVQKYYEKKLKEYDEVGSSKREYVENGQVITEDSILILPKGSSYFESIRVPWDFFENYRKYIKKAVESIFG